METTERDYFFDMMRDVPDVDLLYILKGYYGFLEGIAMNGNAEPLMEFVTRIQRAMDWNC